MAEVLIPDYDVLWWRCAGCGWRSWLHYEHCQQCGRERPVAAPQEPQEQPGREYNEPPWRLAQMSQERPPSNGGR
jgi:hypothetical protein